MKRILLIGLFSVIVISVWTKPVDADKAQQVGQTFLAGHQSARAKAKSIAEFRQVYSATAVSNPVSQSETVPFYIFNSGTNGFVIVAGDDNVRPVLGYSYEGNFAPDNIPPNARQWLEGYRQQVLYTIENNISATDEIRNEWAMYESGNFETAAIVEPLLQTKWNQEPYYNQLCPYDYSANEQIVTGCVATAMAQIMKYWNYPEMGTASHSYTPRTHPEYGRQYANFGNTAYQWSYMPDQLNSSSTDEEVNAVATLMYHCGVSVDMDYDLKEKGGSGAFVISAISPVTHCAEYALKTYFGYKNTLRGIEKDNYTLTAWINLLKSELDAEHPVLYSGYNTGGGHAFVCDGYDSGNYFHFNWGWGGEEDGYFTVSGHDYSSNQQAIIGIVPQTIIENIGDIYEDNDEIDRAYSLPLVFTDNTTNINTEGSTIHTLSDVDYYKIELPAGYDYSFLARTHDSYSSRNGNAYSADVKYSYSINGGSRWAHDYDDIQMPFNIDVSGNGVIYFRILPTAVSDIGTYLLDIDLTRTLVSNLKETGAATNGIAVYPNPAKDMVTIDLSQYQRKVNFISLHNAMGQQIKMSLVDNLLPVSNLPNGIYFIQFHTADGLLTKKITIQK
ncbi:hypothetical protein FACS189434_09600 [Bacteroidia bacterium]|nr:hypothetical protein FACS189434_09600 [Bacteroidia bacterium]